MNQAGTGEGSVRIDTRQDRNDQVRSVAGLILREPFRRRCWAELGFFLASSAIAFAALFALAAVGVVGLTLTVVFAGVMILAAGLRAARGLGRWQRALARRLLGEDIAEPEPFSARPGLFGWLRASFSDRSAWGSVGYLVAKIPLTLFGVWFALGIWFEALFDITSPLTGGRATRFGVFDRIAGHGNAGPGPGAARHFGVFLVGVILLFIAPWAMRLVVHLDKGTMRLLLGPGVAASRVRSLEESRSKTLDAATETLRRIERDLHDGTQAQLVALAMRLGQAKEKLDHLQADRSDAQGRFPDRNELEAIRRLVEDAHRGAKEAITDLRDLARGIHPPALDTGLENALATLAARSPVPVEVAVSVATRPSPAIEAITYFCAAELLANVAQHAHASRGSLACAQHGPWLRVVVRDNGQGGAKIDRDGSSSSGLAGLAERVGAVDGNLSIASPSGGPTVVTVDLPAYF